VDHHGVMELIKTRYVAAGLFSLGLAFTPTLSSAAVLQASAQLLSVCPDLSNGTGCQEGATIYLASGQGSDTSIIDLVTSIAEAGDTPQVPMRVCLDAAQGIRVLGGGVSRLEQRQQILLIADEMCRGAATAAIAENADTNGNGNGGNSNSDAVAQVPVVTVDPIVVDPGNGDDNGAGGNGDGDHDGHGDGHGHDGHGNGDQGNDHGDDTGHHHHDHEIDHGNGDGAGNGNGNGGGNGACAGNSSPGNGNNCDNPNQSHSH